MYYLPHEVIISSLHNMGSIEYRLARLSAMSECHTKDDLLLYD